MGGTGQKIGIVNRKGLIPDCEYFLLFIETNVVIFALSVRDIASLRLPITVHEMWMP
jgi:hypothetical protein